MVIGYLCKLETERRRLIVKTQLEGQVRRLECKLIAGLRTKVSGKNLAGWHWKDVNVKRKQYR